MIHLVEVWSDEIDEYVTIAMDDGKEAETPEVDIQIVD